MTTLEKIMEIVNSQDVDMSDSSPASAEKLIQLAYWFGREDAAREICDKHNAMIADQKHRAEECRYHRMAAEIIGKETMIYSGDYSGDMHGMFGHDPA